MLCLPLLKGPVFCLNKITVATMSLIGPGRVFFPNLNPASCFNE